MLKNPCLISLDKLLGNYVWMIKIVADNGQQYGCNRSKW